MKEEWFPLPEDLDTSFTWTNPDYIFISPKDLERLGLTIEDLWEIVMVC
jgi:hypothetical protein